MRSKVTAILTVIFMVFLSIPTFGSEPQVTADSAIIMDANTGQVLYEKNAHLKRPPASTTKMITALLAIEKGNLRDEVTISKHASQTEESSMELKENDKLSLESLLYGALLWSSNDACVAIGEHIAGDEKTFVGMMNEKARKLGANETHFNNTNGLPDETHYSTAYDLAVIARNALRNQTFAKFVSTKVMQIQSEKNQWFLDNTNRLLWSYEGANGVKTGTTNAAGLCLVSSAYRNGRQVITVVLHSDDRYGDSIRMLDHGFNDFKSERILSKGNTYGIIKVIDGELERINVTVKENVDAVIPIDGEVDKRFDLKTAILAPVQKGQNVGQCEIYIKGTKVAGSELVTLTDMKEASFFKKINRYLEKQFR